MCNKVFVDSLIFDMDGTLWDAVDSYAEIWNVTLDEEGVEHNIVTREDLLRLMGWYLDDILATLVPQETGNRPLLKKVMDNEIKMMPLLGGILYPGVKDLIAVLSQKYKLFMVSNCGPGGLENFVRYNHFEPYFTDVLSHGGTGKSKAENIKELISRYNLRNAVYVGDTQGDIDNAHLAGVPAIWTSYGFGTAVKHADAEIASFSDIEQAIEKLNQKKQTTS